ncbi:MAG TPA: hypothetical protein PKJ56_06155 [Promineifilum sp.]|nr:hypothetical protein [Promineifilum sp.]
MVAPGMPRTPNRMSGATITGAEIHIYDVMMCQTPGLDNAALSPHSGRMTFSTSQNVAV